jgi:uncharacterized protein
MVMHHGCRRLETACCQATEVVMLDPRLLEILACPKCKKGLYPAADHSYLDCQECLMRFRVEDDIPIMLIEEAESLPEVEPDGL